MATIPLDKDLPDRIHLLRLRPQRQILELASDFDPYEARRRHPSHYLRVIEDPTSVKEQADDKNP